MVMGGESLCLSAVLFLYTFYPNSLIIAETV